METQIPLENTNRCTISKFIFILALTAIIILMVTYIEEPVITNFGKIFYSIFPDYVNYINNNSHNDIMPGNISNLWIDYFNNNYFNNNFFNNSFFNNSFFNILLSSSLLIIIPTAIIYYFGTLYNSRTVNSSKEDSCLYGFHFVIIFVIAPLITFLIFYRIGILEFLDWLLQKRLLGLNSSEFFSRIALITITAQLFIATSLLYIYWDSANILIERLYKWSVIKYLAEKVPPLIFKHFPKISTKRETSKSKDEEGNRCSPLKKCAEGRCLIYCMFFLIFSCITIFLTLYCIFNVGTLLRIILLIMSFFILSLIACCIPSILNIHNQVTVILSECQEPLYGELEKNTDTLVRIFTKNGERIDISKNSIEFIKTTSKEIPWKKMFLECIFFWLGIWFAFFSIIVTILLLITQSILYAFICALGISVIDLIFIIRCSDIEADYKNTCS